MLMMAPFFLAIGLLPFVCEDGLKSFWLGAIGAMLMFVLWGSFVPLVKR
jgi:hypothetical protein